MANISNSQDASAQGAGRFARACVAAGLPGAHQGAVVNVNVLVNATPSMVPIALTV